MSEKIMMKLYAVYICNQLRCDSYSDPDFVVKPYLLTSGTMKATGGESFDHLTFLPLQAFSNVYSKRFHSVFS